MISIRNLSVKGKLLGAIIGVALVNGVFAALFFPAQARKQAEASFQGEVGALARTVALGISIGMETGDLSGVQKSMDFAKSDKQVRFVYVQSDGSKLAAFPKGFEMTDAVMSADSLAVGEADVKSDALNAKVFVGASTRSLEAAHRRSILMSLVVGGVLVAFGALVAIWMSGLIVKPLREAVDQINGLAEGELKEWPDAGREDELGQMSRALNRAVLGLKGVLEADSVDWDEIADQRRREAEMRTAEAERIEREREEAQRIQEKEREEAQRLQEKVDRVLGVVRSASGGDLTVRVDIPDEDAVGLIGGGLNELFGDLRESISQLARHAATVGEASRNLSAVTDSIGEEASETSGRATQASDAAGKVSDHVRSVAAATEEMSATVRDIARNAAHAADVARNAVEMAHTTNQTMEALGQSSEEIGSVVGAIKVIAAKTNLLALNATVEAARAGDAGKGFAVVAHEVKELASQSARAAGEIAEKVATIQVDSGAAVSALQAITSIVGEIDEIQGAIAAAVEEQTATTGEIGRSLDEAAGATEQISSTIQGVAQSARSTADGVSRALVSVADLDTMSDELAKLVGRFRYSDDVGVEEAVQYRGPRLADEDRAVAMM